MYSICLSFVEGQIVTISSILYTQAYFCWSISLAVNMHLDRPHPFYFDFC